MFIIQLYHSLFTWGRHQKEYCKKNEIGGKFGRGGGEMSEKLLTFNNIQIDEKIRRGRGNQKHFIS